MPSRRRILSALAPAALVLLALAGCGGGDAPTSASVATTTVTRTVTVPSTTTSTASTAPTTPSSPNAPLSLHAAEQVLDARGYAPLAERDWRPDQSLKVLLGVSRSADPRAEQAFFFVGDAFIGTDTKDPSASIEVVAQSDDSVTIGYGLYRPADQIDVPTGGTAEVTYRWDGSSLTPQDAIPSASTAAPLSRR